MIDLDSTAGCPQASACASCGGAEELQEPETLGTPIGVFCITRCVPCVQHEALPHYAIATAVGLILEHCGHLGITADDMARVMDDEAQQRLDERLARKGR